MSNGEEMLRPRIEELLVPSATDVRRAKRTMLGALEDGRAHRSAWLIARAAEGLGALPHMNRVEIAFHETPRPDAIEPDVPAIAFIRSRLAAMRGLGDLAVAGVVIPASDPGGDEARHEPLLSADQTVSIGIAHPGGGFGVRSRADRPVLSESYMLAQPGEARWYLEPDLFAEEIRSLEFPDRAHRALREALASFRRGLYLACASLLGVVSEAAWYRAAEKVAETGGRLHRDMETMQAAELQQRVADTLRQRRVRPRTLPDELLAHAVILREIRNYGVHPREVRDDIERYFTEEACGLLILQTHHYLTRLAGAVEAATGSETANENAATDVD